MATDHSLPNDPQPDPIWKIDQVVIATGLSRALIYERMAAGDFPLCLRLSPHRVGWRASQVRAWLNARPLGIESASSPKTKQLQKRTAQAGT